MSNSYDIRTSASGLSSYVTISDYIGDRMYDRYVQENEFVTRRPFSANLVNGRETVIPAEYDKLIIKLNIKNNEDDTVEVLLPEKRTFTLNELFECICREVGDKKLYDDYDYADLDELTLTRVIVDGNNVNCNWIGY